METKKFITSSKGVKALMLRKTDNYAFLSEVWNELQHDFEAILYSVLNDEKNFNREFKAKTENLIENE